ncbi:hypothetical protein [Kingella potus]|uniref:hypothetical protein n=1 Tax=Kingella potus TaxID=265175 RepID=UPI001FD032D5|nr:hypothetical protein [Kingella potus]UOP00160.1 hypothetical protein LVJ84_09425 [Kingella potus]
MQNRFVCFPANVCLAAKAPTLSLPRRREREQTRRPSENCNAFFRRPHFSYSAKHRRLQNRVRRLGGTPYRAATLPAVPKQCSVSHSDARVLPLHKPEQYRLKTPAPQ